MKKILTLAAILLVLGLTSVVQAEPILVVGDYAFKFSGVTYADLNYPLLPTAGTIPLAIGGTGSGDTWGIGHITSIQPIIGGTLEQPVLGGAIWSESSGDFLDLRFGGLTLAHPDLTTSAPTSFPYDLYFGLGSGTDLNNGNAYLQIFHTTGTNPAFNADFVSGPGSGAYGSFGTTMDNGALWLDTTISSLIQDTGDPNAQAGDKEKSTVTAITAGSLTAYANIVGGSAAGMFANGLFPLINPDPSGDFFLKSDLTSFLVLGQNGITWRTDVNGWTNDFHDPATARVIPEPSTMVLVGAGLFGLGFFSRRRKQSR